MTARYDGFAEWYDATLGNAELGHFNGEVAARLIGPGPGELVEVGCGGGVAAQKFQSEGWIVTGVDMSEDQLRVARSRGINAVRANAAQLPFDDATFDAAVSIGTHTDFDDFAGAVREIARVVRPAGAFVYVGVHPCFVGPHVAYGDREIPQFHSGYRNIEFSYDAPGISPEGLRAKVGAWHLPLGVFLQSFLDAGFRLERFEEPDALEFPKVVALRLRTPAGGT